MLVWSVYLLLLAPKMIMAGVMSSSGKPSPMAQIDSFCRHKTSCGKYARSPPKSKACPAPAVDLVSMNLPKPSRNAFIKNTRWCHFRTYWFDTKCFARNVAIRKVSLSGPRPKHIATRSLFNSLTGPLLTHFATTFPNLLANFCVNTCKKGC